MKQTGCLNFVLLFLVNGVFTSYMARNPIGYGYGDNGNGKTTTPRTHAEPVFGAVCAFCKQACDCSCVRRTCVDTSCCGVAGGMPSLPDFRPKQISEQEWAQIERYLQRKYYRWNGYF